jgi:hypothetical protein
VWRVSSQIVASSTTRGDGHVHIGCTEFNAPEDPILKNELWKCSLNVSGLLHIRSGIIVTADEIDLYTAV